MINKILVANASEAHLFSAENLRTKDLTLLKDFSHPESRKKVLDLVAGQPSARTMTGNPGSSYEAKHDAKEVEAENFAMELVKIIYAEYKLRTEDKLLIVAPTHFGNLLMKHMHRHFPNIEHLAKDYTKLGIRELSIKLRAYIF